MIDFGQIKKEVADVYVVKFKAELTAQGKYNTGRLQREMAYKMQSDGVDFTAPDYVERVDKGATSAEARAIIAANPAAYRDALTDYFISKRYSQAAAAAFARNTTARHMKEGVPTRASYRFSKNGRRTGFIQAAANVAKNEAADAIGKTVAANVDKMLGGLANELNKS